MSIPAEGQTLYGHTGQTSALPVELTADTEGFEDGTPAEFQIFWRDLRGADVVMETVEAQVESGKVE